MIWQDFSPNWLAKANTAWLPLCALPWLFFCLRMSWPRLPPFDGQTREVLTQTWEIRISWTITKTLWAGVNCQAYPVTPFPQPTPRTPSCRTRLESAWNGHSLPASSSDFSFFSSFNTQQVGGVRSVTLPETLLFVSTLDGSLHAVSKQTGDIKWTLREGPHSWTHPWYYLRTLLKFFIVYFLQIL